MERVCVRPGCDRPARARLAYDTVTCQVWLDQLPERSGRSPEICEMHAERLTVPRGWMLCDRRAAAPALFVADVVAAPADAGAVDDVSPRRRRARRPTDTTRNLFDEIAADISEAPIEVVLAPHLVVVDPVVAATGHTAAGHTAAGHTAAGHTAHEVAESGSTAADSEDAAPAGHESAGHESAGHESDDAQHAEELSVLRATSPLLARAFSQTGPQRSVLTQSSGEDAATD